MRGKILLLMFPHSFLQMEHTGKGPIAERRVTEIALSNIEI